ncbi:MAG: hypothetical protein JWQ29_3169 [Phenylobacterium sp.]|nr:hypothetical protein [Phenylobacterium sp.]
MKKMLLLAAAVLFTAGAAQASITAARMSVTSDGSLFRYSYLGTPADNSDGAQGPRLAIFDLGGFGGGLTAPSGFSGGGGGSAGASAFGGASAPLAPSFSPGPASDPLPPQDLTFTERESVPPTFVEDTASDTISARATEAFAVLGVPGIVPEPATWGLMILGFGGIGALARRRRARPAFA